MKEWTLPSLIALLLSFAVYLFWNSKGKEWEPDVTEMAVLIGLFLTLTIFVGKVAQWWKKRKLKPGPDSGQAS